MKKIFLLGTLVIGSVLINKASAQVEFNATIGVQPQWGPSGYDNAEYYYMPDIETYYCVPSRQFTWFDNGQWVTSPYLPECYANYDLYGGYKVVLNERDPWCHFNEHRRMYAGYRYRHDQVVIRDFYGRGYYGGGRMGYGYNNYGHGGYARSDYGNRGYERRGDWDRNRGGGEHFENRGFNRGENREWGGDHGRGNDRGCEHGNDHGRL